MAIVLTRISEPRRQKLLTLALKRDMESVFPFRTTGNQKQDRILVASAIHNVVTKVVYRPLEIAYNEDLDS